MLLKFKSVDTNSKTIHQIKINFVNEDTSVLEFLSSKNLVMLEVRTGESFTNFVSFDTECEVFRNILFGDLKDTVRGVLHLKVVVKSL